MKKLKLLFMMPLCASLLSGCNIQITKYEPGQNNTITQPSISDKIEAFFQNPQTTYTDNITSITLQTLYETCKKSTVTIEIYTTNSNDVASLHSSGSGVVVKESENYLYIYTNAHVISVKNSSTIKNVETEVILSDYSRYKAIVVASDVNEDVAIIRIDKPATSNYLVASIGDSNEVKPGETVFAIGSPLGLEYASTITQGIISGVNIKEDVDNDKDGSSTTMYLLQTDAALNPGNSGGALFNYKGELIGINTLKLMTSKGGLDVEGMSFAIPINHFELVASTLMNDEIYSRPKIGISTISIATISLAQKKEYEINYSYGLYIDGVTNPNSNLKEKTIITHINNKEVYTFSDLSIELYKYKTGDTVSITYCDLNGNNHVTVNVTLI